MIRLIAVILIQLPAIACLSFAFYLAIENNSYLWLFWSTGFLFHLWTTDEMKNRNNLRDDS